MNGTQALVGLLGVILILLSVKETWGPELSATVGL